MGGCASSPGVQEPPAHAASEKYVSKEPAAAAATAALEPLRKLNTVSPPGPPTAPSPAQAAPAPAPALSPAAATTAAPPTTAPAPPANGHAVPAAEAEAEVEAAVPATATAIIPDSEARRSPPSPERDASSALQTLLRMSSLMQNFAEARNERSTAIQVVKRVLDLIAADCHASVTCLQTISESQDLALVIALLGCPDVYLEQHRVQHLKQGKHFAAELMLRSRGYMVWKKGKGEPVPTDWQALVSCTGLVQLSAIPITVGDKCVGVLTIGLETFSQKEANRILWSSYMQLLASSISNLIKDNSIPKFMHMVRDIHDGSELDALFHRLVGHFKLVLGHSNSNHIWYRMGLTATNTGAATIFDDLTQFGANVTSTPRGSATGFNAGGRQLQDVHANSGVLRTIVNLKSTVMKISVNNRQQVMIPDVQKLINQSGTVSVDIFTTRFIKPPTAVLVFPLKVKQLIFGVIFCMSNIPTDFADVSPRLRELCEVMSPHLLTTLTAGPLKPDYAAVKDATPEMAGSLNGSMSTVGANSQGYSGASAGGVSNGEAVQVRQGYSSTGALVTGLTEKLNHKRIRSAMDISKETQLEDLQVTNLLGEGGFAKVFRGLWQGLVVGIKVVVDDGKSEKMVMKNAHEIAILSTLSHPHVTHAYICLTDVLVHNFINTCFRQPHPSVLTSPAYKYIGSFEDKLCHVEVIEYCDLGNLATALKNQVFYAQDTEKVLMHLAAAAALGKCETSTNSELRIRASIPSNNKVNLRGLLLTLIEIASSLGYLHRMGVVHCDVKPANVLLKSSNNDLRGFSIKVSDFGLSRVEDDDTSSSFPFNSCGTAAYVAPEALICNKKVNSSVDVYAFGVLMWEMYTSQRPYGSMKQQQLVEEVVMRGLRPKFPAHAPLAYVHLAQACWSGAPHLRPTFDEALLVLSNMLQAVDQNRLESQVDLHLSGTSGSVEYATNGYDSTGANPEPHGNDQAGRKMARDVY